MLKLRLVLRRGDVFEFEGEATFDQVAELARKFIDVTAVDVGAVTERLESQTDRLAAAVEAHQPTT